jgi:sugar lactone lactonase YvrE
MTPLAYYPEPRAVLGEAPIWEARTQRLYSVDCDQKKLFRLDPVGHAIETFALPHSPGSYAFRDRGGMLMAYRNQLALLDPEAGGNAALEADGIDFAIERFNDGKCDRAGRFWAGTMDRRMSEPVGALYRIDPDMSVHRMAGGMKVSNGLAFSPDDRIFYHTDSRSGQIRAYDFDIATGEIRNGRIHFDFAGRSGRADGFTIDIEGCLWAAEIDAGRVVRIDPKGRCVREIALPTTWPTSAMFGGAALRTLYVTTMQHRLTEEQLAQQPQAGCLFAIELDVPGLAEPRFAG